MRKATRAWWAAVSVAAWSTGIWCVAAPPADRPVVITNDDLAQRYGPPSAPREAPKAGEAPELPPAAPPPPADGPSPDIAAQREHLVAELARLRRRELSLRNPLLPRERPNESEAEREDGLDSAQRLAIVQAHIRVVAEQLATIDARFGPPGRDHPPRPGS